MKIASKKLKSTCIPADILFSSNSHFGLAACNRSGIFAVNGDNAMQ